MLGQLPRRRFAAARSQRPQPPRSSSAAARVSSSLRRAEEIIYGACLSGVNSRRRRPAAGGRPTPLRGRQSGGVHLLHQVDGAVVKSSTSTRTRAQREVSSLPALGRCCAATICILDLVPAGSIRPGRHKVYQAWSPQGPSDLVPTGSERPGPAKSIKPSPNRVSYSIKGNPTAECSLKSNLVTD